MITQNSTTGKADDEQPKTLTPTEAARIMEAIRFSCAPWSMPRLAPPQPKGGDNE